MCHLGIRHSEIEVGVVARRDRSIPDPRAEYPLDMPGRQDVDG